MHTQLDCIPCFLRQALGTIRRLTDDEEIHARLMCELLRGLGDLNMADPPPVIGRHIHRLIRHLLDDDDPYRAVKTQFNRHALALYPSLKRRIDESADPFDTAVRLAIAGNTIDFAALDDVTEAAVLEVIERALSQPLRGTIDGLEERIASAGRLLYLADNAGEIVFDRLLIERMPRQRITLAVRGRPVINDATCEDAEAAGLTGLVEVIDNGSDAPGTILEDCSPDFRRRFDEADLILAKGMGNFETLNAVKGRPLYFLLMAKCPLVAQHIGCAEGDFVVAMTGDGGAEDRGNSR
jgi:uncharacterized protein with ATP-grasp and redox domains